MKSPQASGLMYEILRKKDEINRICSKLTGAKRNLFEPLSLPMPVFKPAELGFLRATAWLYVLYFEAGRAGVPFLLGRFEAYNRDPSGKFRTHREKVNQLRTFLQHNTDPTTKHNQAIQFSCDEWFRVNCGTAVPSAEPHWQKCLVAILTAALEFFGALLQTLRDIEADESAGEILRSWNWKIERSYSPYEFDTLISKAANDMGREAIDATRIRKPHFDRWIQQLMLLQDGADVESEARRLVEATLLTSVTPLLPISGEDIIRELGVPPGPLVGEMLRSAKKKYEANVYSKLDLLEQLRHEFGERLC
jgi:hypothetical protein